MSKILDMQRQTGFSQTTKRSPEDFYVTPDKAIRALLKREKFSGIGWEPACGNGAITKFFPGIKASDIRTDSDIAGKGGIDFLAVRQKVDFIITNPPFCLITEFIEHSLKCAKMKVAIFGRIQLLEGKKRYHLFMKHPPVRIYVFSSRLNCDPDSFKSRNVGILCFCWFVWEKGFHGKPTIDWICFK